MSLFTADELDAEVHPTKTVEEARALLGVSRQSAYAAVKSGDIPSIRVGGRILIPTAALRRLLQLDVPAHPGGDQGAVKTEQNRRPALSNGAA